MNYPKAKLTSEKNLKSNYCNVCNRFVIIVVNNLKKIFGLSIISTLVFEIFIFFCKSFETLPDKKTI